MNDHDQHQESGCNCDVTPERVDMARRRLMTRAAGAAAAGAAAITGGTAIAATDEARA